MNELAVRTLEENSQNGHEKEVHGQLATMVYRKGPEGLSIMEFRDGSTPCADSPTAREVLQKKYSGLNSYLSFAESPSISSVEIKRRGTNAGVIPFIQTEEGLKMMFMVKNFSGKCKIDPPAGGPNGDLDLEKARRREVFGEEFVMFNGGKLILPEGHEKQTINYIMSNLQRAKSLGLEVPSNSEETIMRTYESIMNGTQDYKDYSQSISTKAEGIDMGNIPPATVTIVGTDHKTSSSSGFYVSHLNGGDLVVPVLYPSGLSSSLDLECLEKNRDEDPMALDRDKIALTKDEHLKFYEGADVRVQTITKNGIGDMTINRTEYPLCPLGEAVTELYLGIRMH